MDAKIDRVLNGHLRDGTPLPDAPKQVDPVGVPPAVSNYPIISADAEGAWAGWQQTETTVPPFWLLVQRLGLDGAPLGKAVKLTNSPLDDPGGVAVSTLLTAESGVAVLEASNSAFYRTMVSADGKVSPPFRFVHGNGQDESILIHELFATEWNGETWLAYAHNAEYMRVLKVRDGCTYPFAPVGKP